MMPRRALRSSFPLILLGALVLATSPPSGAQVLPPLSSEYAISCYGTVVPTGPGQTFVILCQTLRRNQQTSRLEPFCPDTPPYYRVNATTSTGDVTILAEGTGQPAANEPCSYWTNWTVPQDYPNRQAANLIMQASMSGTPINVVYPLLVTTEAGSDPIHVSADYSWDTHNATIVVSTSYANGTLRTARTPTVAIYDPESVSIPTGTPALLGQGRGVWVLDVPLGTSPTRGTYTVFAGVEQPWCTTTPCVDIANSATTFSIDENWSLAFQDQRQLTFDLASWLNESFEKTWQKLDELANASSTERASNATLNVTVQGAAGTSTLYAGTPSRLNATISTPGNSTARPGWFYTWDFGDNTTSLGAVTYHAWAKPGNYTVRVLVNDAFGSVLETQLPAQVVLAVPELNVSGPRSMNVGEVVTFTKGTSRVPAGEVAYSFVSDPRSIDLWLLGKRYYMTGYCGPQNATELRMPDFDSLTLGPLQVAWEITKKETCEEWTTAFLTPGEHEVILRAFTPQGAYNETKIIIRVASVSPGGSRTGEDALDVVNSAPSRINEGARSTLNGLNWLVRLLNPLSWVG
jgi:PKD domain